MSATRLPGVYFETVVPPIPETLPRMDIPAFVGFAASGPLDIPVAVEDMVRFHEIFGQDQPLAWDTERGETAYAQLPPAVRAFFRNGGQRCWVVRVADNQTARSNGFIIPGLLQAASDKPYQGAWVEARSQGSWSDDLMVNASLTWEPLAVDTAQASESGYLIALPAGVHSSLAAGDMLQLLFSGSQANPPAASDAMLFLPLQEVTSERVATSSFAGAPAQQTLLRADHGFWFQPVIPNDFPALSFSPPMYTDSAGICWLEPPRASYWLTQAENAPLSLRAWGFSTAQNQFVLDVFRADIKSMQPGSWLLLEFDPLLLPAGATALLLQVGKIRGPAKEPPSVSPAPSSGDGETALIVGSGAWWALDEEYALSRYTSAPQVTVVRLELWVRNGQGEISRLRDLRLAPPHARYLGHLPSDVELFQASDTAGTPPGEMLRQEASHPRFPLAAPGSVSKSTIYLPLAVPVIPNDDFYQPATAQTASALERDGLAPPRPDGGPFFSADFFLDPDLAGSGVSTLLTEAFHKQYQLRRDHGSGRLGEPLVKMHSVIPLAEVSLLAVPDAIHRGWVPYAREQHPLLPPQLLSISAAAATGKVTASWTMVEGAVDYTLQQATDPQFGDAADVWEGSATQSDPLAQAGRCPSPRYFRVRASGASGVSPWSNTLAEVLPAETFELCKPERLDAPVLAPPAESRGRTALQWSMAAPGNYRFRLEMAAEPAFELPELLYEGDRSWFEVWRSPTRISYFRVSATLQERKSSWSNTVFTHPEIGTAGWKMVTSRDSAASACEDELRLIHQAMLRLCAARADLVALLSLPSDYRTDSVLSYKDRLVMLLAPEETERTLSFGAIYHPWLLVRDAADDSGAAIRAVVPDGTICGSIAARTLASGAWVCPANQPLRGVVDLLPRLAEEARQLFQDGQVNLVTQESRGFLCSSAYTLSTDSEVRELNVRRLLILLRRLALREGMAYVFLPNDEALRYLVRRRFEEVLGNLFALGAFAGDTQAQAFRVVTDNSVNLPETIEQGRFVVELRVAPSLPMAFLTVRLMQTGGEIVLSEEL